MVGVVVGILTAVPLNMQLSYMYLTCANEHRTARNETGFPRWVTSSHARHEKQLPRPDWLESIEK